MMIDYLTRLVGDEELALDMYLPLCNAAFCTLNPVSAFVTGAYQYVAKHKPDLRAATNTYRNRIKRIFDETTEHLPNSERFRAPRQLSELEVSLVDLPPLKLTMREVVDIRSARADGRTQLSIRWRNAGSARRRHSPRCATCSMIPRKRRTRRSSVCSMPISR